MKTFLRYILFSSAVLTAFLLISSSVFAAGPTANNDNVSTGEDTVRFINVLQNDLPNGSGIMVNSVTIVTAPLHGSVTVFANGSVRYTPANNYAGPDQFVYKVKDSTNTFSNNATVFITINPVNDAPVVGADAYTMDEDLTLTITAALGLLNNDSDIDGGALSVIANTSSSQFATINVNANGSFTYTPPTNFFGKDTFEYIVSDGLGGLGSNSVIITVNPQPDAPTAVNDFYSTNEDQFLAIAAPGFLANDYDVDLTTPAYLSATPTSKKGGTVVAAPTGAFNYTPPANFFGTDTFEYVIIDNISLKDTGYVIITVNPVIDAPVIFSPLCGGAVMVSGSSIEPNGTAINVYADGVSIAAGTVVNGLWNLVVNPLITGQVITATAGIVPVSGLSNSVTVCNNNPVAVNDNVVTNEDTPVGINATGNDTDLGGTIDVTTVTITQVPAHGTVMINPVTGLITYTPAANYNGPDSIKYTVKDNSGAVSNVAKISITVTPVADLPVANNDAVNTNEEVAVVINILANDNAPDGTLVPSSVIIVSNALHGTTVKNAITGEVTYTPALNYFGPDQFTYTVRDNLNQTSNIATVTINVLPLNDAPVAMNDNVVTNEDVPVTFNTSLNDIDVDGNLNQSTVTIVVSAVHGTAVFNPVTRTITYTPDANYNGPDSLSYTVRDSLGAISNIAKVYITVTPVVDLPVANNDAVSTNEDVAKLINMLANDSAPDGNLVPSSVIIISNVTHGSTVLNPVTGEVTYTPAANYTGPDQFTYTVKDNLNQTSNIATVTINVLPINDAPVAVNDTITTTEDTPVTFNTSINDYDVDGNLNQSTVIITINVLHGTAVFNPVTRTITYTPALNYNGPDSLSYTVKDSLGVVSNTAKVYFSVVPAGDPPVAVDDAVSTNEDTPVGISILTNDSSPDGTLAPSSITIISAVAHGSTVINTTTGVVTYTPAANYVGPDQFTYTVKDNLNQVSNTATVNINVLPVNDAPVANNDALTIPEDSPSQPVTVLVNDTDLDGTIDITSVIIVRSPTRGAATVNALTGVISYQPIANFFGRDTIGYQMKDNLGLFSNTGYIYITVTPVADAPVAVDDAISTNEDVPVTFSVSGNDVDADGNLNPSTVTITTNPVNGTAMVNPVTGVITYTPALNFYGVDSLKYTIKDSTNLTSNVAVVLINVIQIIEPPVAIDDNVNTNEDVPVTINIPGNDYAPDGTLVLSSVTIISGVANGNISVNPVTGEVTYTPNNNYSGTDQFTYTINDNLGQTSNVATVTITVGDVNDAPVAVNDALTIAEDAPAQLISILANDYDTDGTIDATTVAIVQIPSNGTYTLDPVTGEITYTPNANFFGNDTLIYTVKDNLGLISNSALLIITVTPVNDAPVAVGDNAVTNEDTSVSFDVTLNDSDVDGNLNIGTVNVMMGTLHGTLSVLNGVVTYTPYPNYYGIDSFTYSIQDSTLLTSNIVTVIITVLPVNDAPVANDDMATTDPGVLVHIDELTNDQNPEGNILTVSVIDGPSNGTFVINGSGTISYTPDITFLSGTDTITYEICDNGTPSLCDTAIIVIYVPLQNLPPVVTDETLIVFEDQPGIVNVLTNDYDPNGDAITVNISVNAAHGFATISPSGLLTYLPDPGYSGVDTVFYEVCDNRTPSLCGNGFVAILVLSLNDHPIAVNDTLTTVQEQLISYAISTNDDITDGPAAIYTLLDLPVNGVASVSTFGQLDYTPGYEFVGLDSLSYILCDGASPALCDTAWVFINVDELPNKNIISGKFFNDYNSDGIFNIQDIGQAAVTVHLYKDVNADGAVDAGDVLRATRLTQALGNFEFRVTRGDFIVTIDAADLPLGYTFTTPNIATATFTTPSGNADNDNNIAYAGELITSYAVADGIFNDETPDTLMAINRLTGKNVIIGETGTYGVEAMAIFKGDSIVVADGEYLGYLDNGTGAFAPFTKTIGTGNGPQGAMAFFDIDGLTYSPSENVFYASKAIPGHAKDMLIKINALTGELIKNAFGQDTDYVVIDDLEEISDLAIDPVSDELYAINRDASDNNLITINKKTGEVTVIGALNMKDVEGLSFYNDGLLYATTGASSTASNSSSFFTIDAATANVVKRGTFVAGKDFEAFASLLERPNTMEGFVFHDEDLDTLFDNVELGIANVTVKLYDLATDQLLQTTKTDANGEYRFILGIKGNFIAHIDESTLPGGNFMTTDNNETASFASYGNTTSNNNFGAKFNLAPLAIDDNATTEKNAAVAIKPLDNDGDGDGNIDITSFTIITPPLHGTVTYSVLTQVANYTPDAEYVGADTFAYRICDNGIPTMCDTANVIITVTNITSLPVAVNDTVHTNKNQPISINAALNDYDIDGTIIPSSLMIITQPLNGAIFQVTNGKIVYQPQLNFFGVDSLSYLIRDNDGAISNEAKVYIHVDYINIAPVAINDNYSTPKSTSKKLVKKNVVENDKDIDGTLDLSTFTVSKLPDHGTLTYFNALDSSLTYAPDSNYTGQDYFVYSVKDDLGLVSNNDTVFINVLNYNTPPVAINDNVETGMDELLGANIAMNDYDFDDNLDRASIIILSAPSFGDIVLLDANGNVNYQPSRGYVGKDQFTYVIKDENGSISNEATVTIEVNSVSLDKFSAPTVFSPNGDGKNDKWVIRKLNGYPINEVSVFNRAGTEVFRKSGYRNDWDGSELPEGTYYYVIKINDDNDIRNFSGFVTIVR